MSPPAGKEAKPAGLLSASALAIAEMRLNRIFTERCWPAIPLRLLLPPLARIGGLLELAADVRRGRPGAPPLLREALGSISSRRRRRGVSDWVEAALPAQARCGDHDEPTPPEVDLIARRPWAELVGATAYAARDREELAELLEALIDGLRGYRALTHLVDVARAGDETRDEAVLEALLGVIRRLYGDSLPPGISFAGQDRSDSNAEPSLIQFIAGGLAVPRLVVPIDPALIEQPPDLPAWVLDCLRETTIRVELSGIGVRGDGYEIASITPEEACPRDLLVIEGRGFTGTAAVEFTGARRPIAVTPSSIADTRIEVEFPRDAVTGPVWLYIPESVPTCAGLSSLFARAGQPGEVAGGRAEVLHFDFSHNTRCLPVGFTENLLWSVVPQGAQVQIIDHFAGARRVLHDTTEAEGFIPVSLGPADIGVHQLEIVASGPCGDPFALGFSLYVGTRGARFSIAGAEYTQGIQRFDQTDFANAANNSIDLIAGKTTVVRVYVRNEGGTGSRAWISGVLRLDGVEYTPTNRNAAGEPFIRLGLVPSRNRTDGTLNFEIPAAAATGTHTAEVDVFSVDACPVASASTTLEIAWTDYPAFPVRVIQFEQSGLGRIGDTAARQTITRAFDRLPSNMDEVRFNPRPFVIHPGTTEDNYCHDGGYYQLALSLAYQHNFDEGIHHSSSWVGLYADADCSARGMMSWPYTSTCISENNAATAAHEIAHTIGMGHTWEWCENLFQPVACHKPLPFPGLNTEVVFDIRARRVRLRTPDLQSYRPGFRFLRPEHWEMTRDLMTSRF